MQAAKAAGWRAVLVVRPGNKPLPPAEEHGFPVISSMAELLDAAAGSCATPSVHAVAAKGDGMGTDAEPAANGTH
jgi:hypothetical protein